MAYRIIMWIIDRERHTASFFNAFVVFAFLYHHLQIYTGCPKISKLIKNCTSELAVPNFVEQKGVTSGIYGTLDMQGATCYPYTGFSFSVVGHF